MEDAPSKLLCDELTSQFPAADGGPAHVVVSDYNLEDDPINNALAKVSELRTGGHWWGRKIPTYELDATEQTLRKLLAIPEAERCAWYGGAYADASYTD